ncbi:hypothetical protein [Saccharothrix sp. ST-888]|uniref:hypothetical protein n=1 Tax=Saccharothrix sp. ST-888 TaxID=1427391 RepID=UPI0005EC8024|nr:hypothetical protein [Saccharothrix sp. ST-888]KJK55414.1 hypothetical protein UK12_28755 [Saccharothrix sp. ST-888]
MIKPYPIVEQRPLADPPKRGPFGLGARRRSPEELPVAAGHEVLVYRVDGRYVLDTGRRRPGDEQLVAADHVSVVDLRRNAPVTVQLKIPSAEAAEFTVEVTFLCSVVDPAIVVREGQGDARLALLAYLRKHKRFFELGLDYRISQITTVRRNVNAQMMAYTAERPPQISGLAVSFASVELLEPDELIGFQRQRRDQDRSNVLAFEKQQQNHTLDVQRQQYDQEIQEGQLRFDQDRDVDNQTHEQLLDQEAREFALRQSALTARQIGDNPEMAAYWAQASGEMSAADLLAQLQRKESLKREDRRDLAERRWERRQEILEQKRQRRRELEDRIRDDQKEREQLDRELTKELSTSRRADQQWERDATLEVVRDLIKRGHGDQTFVDFERLLGKLGAPPELEGAAPQRDLDQAAADEPEALEAGAAERKRRAYEKSDVLREEDDD